MRVPRRTVHTCAALALALALCAAPSARAACVSGDVVYGQVPAGCSGDGGPCGLTNDDNLCLDASDASLACNEDTGVCGHPPSYASIVGETCTSGQAVDTCAYVNDVMSENSLLCDYIRSKCTANLGVGDYCTVEGGTMHNDCNTNVCTDGLCAGIPEGSACVSSEDCALGLWCEFSEAAGSRSCVPRIDTGGTCPTNSDSCKVLSRCTDGGSCVDYLSVPDGGTVDTAWQVQCQSGYAVEYLHTSDKCATYDPQYVGQSCSGNEHDLTCVCDVTGLNGYLMPRINLGGAEELAGFFQCVENSACVPKGTYWSNVEVGSCLYYKCRGWFIEVQCTRQPLGPPSAGLPLKLGFPQCYADWYNAVYATKQSCVDYFTSCEAQPDGRGECSYNFCGADPPPCENGGTCTNLDTTFECACDEDNWAGSRCQYTSTDPCRHEQCINGGTCETTGANEGDYTCHCTYGWGGTDCQTDLTVDECATGTAHCEHGDCVDGIGEYTCTCDQGWMGDACDVDVDECANGDGDSPCLNGATCNNEDGTFTCTCAAGFDGDDCGHEIDECSPNPCDNGSTCVDNVGSHTCTCTEGWMGLTCAESVDDCSPDPCQHGTCTDGHMSYTCTCDQGFVGTDCETNINDCGSAGAEPLCLNGGTCVDDVDGFHCTCATGYVGWNCAYSDCSSQPCKNGAVCTNVFTGAERYKCTCAAGWQGDVCDQDVITCVDNSLCGGDDHGTCVEGIGGADNYSCDCEPAYTGNDCSQIVDACAANNGLGPCDVDHTAWCTNLAGAVAQCTCNPGYFGTLCDSAHNACDPDPCLNGGECRNSQSTFFCSCAPGYVGVVCATDIDDCAGSPCQHGGTCEDAVDGYVCHCDGHFTGTNCEDSPCADVTCGDHGACQQSGEHVGECSCTGDWSGPRCETAPPDCYDGERNGHESDTDCGAPGCALCDAGFRCTVADNCIAGTMCAASNLCTDTRMGGTAFAYVGATVTLPGVARASFVGATIRSFASAVVDMLADDTISADDVIIVRVADMAAPGRRRTQRGRQLLAAAGAEVEFMVQAGSGDVGAMATMIRARVADQGFQGLANMLTLQTPSITVTAFPSMVGDVTSGTTSGAALEPVSAVDGQAAGQQGDGGGGDALPPPPGPSDDGVDPVPIVITVVVVLGVIAAVSWKFCRSDKSAESGWDSDDSEESQGEDVEVDSDAEDGAGGARRKSRSKGKRGSRRRSGDGRKRASSRRDRTRRLSQDLGQASAAAAADGTTVTTNPLNAAPDAATV